MGGDVAELTGRERAGQPAITCEPLEQVGYGDVELVRPTVSSLVSLQPACPELAVLTKPQPQIVPLALQGVTPPTWPRVAKAAASYAS